MFHRRTPPSPPPIDPAEVEEAKQAQIAAHESYQESVVKATVAVQTGDRLRQIRIRNGLGPAFGLEFTRGR